MWKLVQEEKFILIPGKEAEQEMAKIQSIAIFLMPPPQYGGRA